jgi:hypothetical protein
MAADREFLDSVDLIVHSFGVSRELAVERCIAYAPHMIARLLAAAQQHRRDAPAAVAAIVEACRENDRGLARLIGQQPADLADAGQEPTDLAPLRSVLNEIGYRGWLARKRLAVVPLSADQFDDRRHQCSTVLQIHLRRPRDWADRLVGTWSDEHVERVLEAVRLAGGDPDEARSRLLAVLGQQDVAAA